MTYLPSQKTSKISKAFGTWPSPITVDLVAEGSIRFGEPNLVDGAIVWPQSLPADGGRMTLMRAEITSNLSISEASAILPAHWDIRSKVHEYGGGAYAVSDELLYFVNAKDQQIYKTSMLGKDNPVLISECVKSRFANLVLHPSGNWLFCVREVIEDNQQYPTASVIAIAIGKNEVLPTNNFIKIASGEDFYSGLCISPNGHYLAFISWQNPDMPWDNTLLWQTTFDDGQILEIEQVAGNRGASDNGESILQPKYSPDNHLYYISDRSNWWNIYQFNRTKNDTTLIAVNEECATPQWTFGMSNWGFVDADNVLIAATKNGKWSLSIFNITDKTRHFLAIEYSVFSHLSCSHHQAALLCAGPFDEVTPAVFDLHTKKLVPFKNESTRRLDNRDISAPQSLSFTTTLNEQVQYWYYAPTNQQFCGIKNSTPPLIVIGHGGPTGMTETAFNLKIQFWTSRGFAVADVNYRGSTGFGRLFRQSLAGRWGILDVEDLCQAAKHSVEQKLAHSDQKIIKGSSAGGYSVLAALTTHSIFDAGISLYGIADLELLAKDTHKFEAHYLDNLIGKYPDELSIYKERSPINHIESLNCPILVAQGLDDKVVPPSQAELIVNSAKNNGNYVEYLAFKGEGHGFRKADTIKKLFKKEYDFYCKIFDLK